MKQHLSFCQCKPQYALQMCGVSGNISCRWKHGSHALKWRQGRGCKEMASTKLSVTFTRWQALVQTAVQFADANCAIFEPELGEHKLVCAEHKLGLSFLIWTWAGSWQLIKADLWSSPIAPAWGGYLKVFEVLSMTWSGTPSCIMTSSNCLRTG